jgi:selenocysteine lyase/cysteine desulfurase
VTSPAEELIYLDHSATSWPKAPGVGEAMASAVEAGNPGRGGHRAAREAGAIVDATRAALASLLGEDDPRRVVFTSGCTDSVHTAIEGVVRACERAEPGETPQIVFSAIEHNAVARGVAALASVGRASSVIVPVDATTRVDPEAVASACTAKTRLVCVLHASNVTGAVQPIRAIADAVRESSPNALLLVDAAQTIGVIPVRPHEMGADLVAFGSHKGLRGPAGVGGLWIGERAWANEGAPRRIDPVRCGGTGTASEGDAMPDVLPLAFEAGSANVPAIAGLGAAVRQVDLATTAQKQELARELVTTLRDRFGGRVTVYGRADDAGASLPTIALNFDGWEAGDLAQVLDASFAIATRAGLHCSPRCHEAMGTTDRGGTLRVSLGATTTKADTDRLLEALSAVVGSA